RHTRFDCDWSSDVCSSDLGSGRVASFGKLSDPVLTAEASAPSYPAGAPYASGLSTDGKLIAAAKAKPTFYGTPLVAWLPASGASQYEVQVSKTLYPWKTEGQPISTPGTS